MKKRTLFNLLLVFLICFSSCDDGNDPDTDKDIIVENNNQLTQSVYADAATGNSEVSFTTTGAWTSVIYEKNLKSLQKENYDPGTMSPGWISITPDAGKEAGDYEITINLTQNTTGTDRIAAIILTCGESKITITITQKATKEDGTVPGENTKGYVKKINGTEVHYNNKNQVTGFGNEIFTDYTIKGGSYDLINLVYINHNNWQYDYTFDEGYIRYIEFAPNIHNQATFKTYYKQGNDGDIYHVEGTPAGVSAEYYMTTTFEYSDKVYALGNLDISFMIASDRYYSGPIYVAFDGNAGIRSKHLIAKAIQTLPGVDGKYDEERVYRYEFNDDGYVTHIYSNGQLLHTLEY